MCDDKCRAAKLTVGVFGLTVSMSRLHFDDGAAEGIFGGCGP